MYLRKMGRFEGSMQYRYYKSRGVPRIRMPLPVVPVPRCKINVISADIDLDGSFDIASKVGSCTIAHKCEVRTIDDLTFSAIG